MSIAIDCNQLINVSSHKNHKKYLAIHFIISLFRCNPVTNESNNTSVHIDPFNHEGGMYFHSHHYYLNNYYYGVTRA